MALFRGKQKAPTPTITSYADFAYNRLLGRNTQIVDFNPGEDTEREEKAFLKILNEVEEKLQSEEWSTSEVVEYINFIQVFLTPLLWLETSMAKPKQRSYETTKSGTYSKTHLPCSSSKPHAPKA